MWKLHRYYLREVTTSSLITFFVLFGIVMISLVARGIERAQGGDLWDATQIMLLWSADTVPHLLAIALLFGTVLTFARAAHDREITAIRSAGISPRVPMVSALLVGIVFALLGMVALHKVIPWVHYHKYRVGAEIVRNVLTSMGFRGDRLEIKGGVMTWERKSSARHFHDVVVYLPRGGLLGESAPVKGGYLYTASEAWFENDERTDTLMLHFKDVREPATGEYGGQLRLAFNVREVSERGRRSDTDRDLSSEQLLGEVARGVHENPNGARYTVHRRSCYALLPLLFAPIGFCLGVLARDRGRMTALVFSLAPLILFYASDVFGQRLVQVVDLPLLGFLPAAVIAGIGVPFCWRLLRV
jgi:lipopolysaccharide export LptBFGC system permease protein LptF